jgi:4-alpha-glucanotransferase
LNTPGTSEGNWQWRFRWGMMREDHFAMLQHFAGVYGRKPQKAPAKKTPCDADDTRPLDGTPR